MTHADRLRRERSTDPADAFEAAEPEPLPLATVEELVSEVDCAIEEIFAGRVLDDDAEAIRKWFEPKLRRKLMGAAAPVRWAAWVASLEDELKARDAEIGELRRELEARRGRQPAGPMVTDETLYLEQIGRGQ